MLTTPTPILPYTINLVLGYISPPSQLEQPLPSQLISKSLLQRHHFVHPEHPHDYLCWPSPHQHQTISLLESLTLDHDRCTSYPVRYSSDDQTYAHVAVTPGLRIVFQWDPFQGWKYHDANIMPFPPGCQQSLHDAIVSPHRLGRNNLSDHGDGADDRAYWDAYGQGDDIPEPELLDIKENASQDCAEDAYWAQYATVHGSGDSTLPSPLSQNRGRLHIVPPDAKLEKPIIFSYASLHPRTHTHLEPPSPTTLTAALNSLSPRKSLDYSTFEPSLDLESPSPPSGMTRSVDSVLSPKSPNTDGIVSSIPNRNNEWAKTGKETDNHGTHHEDGYEEALRDSIGGLYRLWVARHRKGSVPPSTDLDNAESCRAEKELFLRMVGEVVQLPSLQ